MANGEISSVLDETAISKINEYEPKPAQSNIPLTSKKKVAHNAMNSIRTENNKKVKRKIAKAKRRLADVKSHVECRNSIIGDIPIPTKDPNVSTNNLPPGWYRKIVKRQGGATSGKYDVYIFSPENKKYRSRMEIQRFLDLTESHMTVDMFDFSWKGKEHTAVEASPRARPSRENLTDTPVSKSVQPPRQNLADTPVSTCKKRRLNPPSSHSREGKLLVKMMFPVPKRLLSTSLSSTSPLPAPTSQQTFHEFSAKI